MFPPGLTLPSERLWKGRRTPGHHAPRCEAMGRTQHRLEALLPDLINPNLILF